MNPSKRENAPMPSGTEGMPHEREPEPEALPRKGEGPRKTVMDITRPEEVAGNFYLHQPDIVIHTAAMTDVDGCELDPSAAIRVNALGTQNLVIAAEEFNSVFVYLSTDYVFPGDAREPYTECDRPNPLSWYGKSKLLGEQYVQNMLFRYFIVRTSWLIGEKGRNFVKMILKLGREKDELAVVKDQRGCPTFAIDLAKAIRELIETPYYGTYHITNEGETTWYDFAVRILKEAGIETPVLPITSEELGRPAPRPAYSVLSGLVFRERGFTPLKPWDEALIEYLSKIGERGGDT
jgi:dTDP-4-dehydrorhamnose reductase